MADFVQAIKWMKEGKKVTRPAYLKGVYFELHDEFSIHKIDGKYRKDYTNELFIKDFESINWKIYEEESNLSDQIQGLDLSEDSTDGRDHRSIEIIHIKKFINIIKNKAPKELAKLFHGCYEFHSIKEGWQTQKSCRVKFDDLPEENKRVMILTAKDIITALNADINKNAGKNLI